MAIKAKTHNKWLVLILATLVHLAVVGIPWTVMPVLFTSAAKELNLSLGQIGVLWSMLPIGAAVFAIPGGLLGDRFGFVKIIGIGSFIVALTSGLRGVSPNIVTLMITMLLCGASIALVFPNVPKVASLFFPPRQVGLATGILVAGFALGGVLATALSATVLLPLLGSWRNVLFFYSAICLILGIIWLSVMRTTGSGVNPVDKGAPLPRVTFRKSLATVLSVRDTWLLTIGNLGIVGSYISLNGYLPTYLEKAGLPKSLGDTMVSMLFVASIFGAILIPALADRLGARKMVLVIAAIITFVSTLSLAVSGAALFWLLIPLIGAATQGVGTLIFVQAVQTKGIGLLYAGTAIGLVGCFANLGGFILPIVGGRLAEHNQSLPFVFWSVMVLLAAGCFALLSRNKS